jgi:type VI secretion system secreted protein Hcp
MAGDMFIKIEDIEGESADEKHKGDIEVLAWSWGESQTGSMSSGGGGGTGKVSMQDVSITKWVDKASPKLLNNCASGKHIKKAVLTVRKAGEKPLEYIKMTLEDLLISSISVGGSQGEERLTENVTLNFSVIHYDYTPQNPDGGPGTMVPFGWDLKKNTKV